MADTTRISDLMLERYVAGDLAPAQRARIEAAASSTPAVAARIKAIETDRNAFLVASPPKAAAHRIVTRLAVEREKQPRRMLWWLFPPVGVAAALLFGVVFQRSLGPQSVASSPQVVSDDAYELAQREPARAWEPAALAQPVGGGGMQEQPEQKIVAVTPPQDEASSMSRGAVAPAVKAARPRTQADRNAEVDREHDARLADKAAAVERRSAKKDVDGLSTSGGGLGRAASGYAQAPPESPAYVSTPVPEPVTEKPKRDLAKPAPREEAEVYEGAPPPAASAPAPAPPPAPAKSESARAAKGGPPATALAEPADDAKNAATESAPKGSIGSFISLTRQLSDRAHAIGQKEMLAPNTAVVATTTASSGVMTLIGVRPNGKAFVYGQVTLTGATATITARIRPSETRVVEALFVTVTDGPVSIDKAMEGPRDASRLPLRLTVGGVQRRYVITVTQVE